jgi:hypothetical protein
MNRHTASILNDQLRGLVRNPRRLPGLDLPAHRLEVALHAGHSDGEDVHEAQMFGVLGEHGREYSLNAKDNFCFDRTLRYR